MCFSETVSLTMVGVGVVATAITAKRGDPVAIWGTMAYFTAMEALQAAGYGVIDQCDNVANQTNTILSYLHIAFQPLVISAFCMAITPSQVSATMRKWVYGLAALATATMLFRLIPIERLGACSPGDALCGLRWCLLSGNLHLAWEVPMNNLWGDLLKFGSFEQQFPEYIFVMFVLPLFYGCWRFVLFHAIFGPILSQILTDNPNESPAIWCVFSVGILIIGLSPAFRERVFRARSSP